ncbi:MAG: allantoinase [Deltaproteobacteria bacterium]|nr:allantoinase [Deltaproteobacteria bacterium]
MVKLRAISGGKKKEPPLSLVYGLRLYNPGEVAGIGEGSVTLANGSESQITLHLIEGSREQIRAQLLASIDAFFDI